MRAADLVRGLPGHPTHPPLTDVTIGTYTLAMAAALVDVLGLADENGARAWSLAIVFGLLITGPTALTGLLDWLKLTAGTPLRRTATSHMIAMLSATVFFLLAALVGYSDGSKGVIEAGAFVLTLIGFGLLTLGGWLGGTIVFVHGMRVLNLVEEPAAKAASPAPQPEHEAAARD